MEIDKIEVLVNKIDQAIRIIENLKNENNSYVEKIEDIEKRLSAFEKENIKLKEINKSQKDEIDKNNSLHKRLEEKIQLILNHLPDETPVKKVKKEIKKDKNIFEVKDEEKEEDELKRFAQNPGSLEKKGLFESEKEEEAAFDKPFEDDSLESTSVGVDIKFNENLLVQTDNEEVDFYIDEEGANKEELPRGVL